MFLFERSAGHILETTGKDDILAQINATYPQGMMFQAQKLFELGRVTLSFLKGGLDNHLVVSGIVAENNTTYETKFTWKRADLNFATRCSCPLFSQEGFCVHSAALWLKWHQFSQAGEEQKISSKSAPHFFGEGVSPVRFGTQLRQASYLQGAKASSTFGALSYQLTNRKVVNYPESENFYGTIVINLIPTETDDETRDLVTTHGKYLARFSWKNPEGELIEEVSIFDFFTLFNWREGKALNLPHEVMETFKKMKQLDLWLTVNEWIRVMKVIYHREAVDLIIAGKP